MYVIQNKNRTMINVYMRVDNQRNRVLAKQVTRGILVRVIAISIDCYYLKKNTKNYAAKLETLLDQ